MSGPLRLMCILAHPDDESLGVGSTLATYAAIGVETYLVTATRGERGWTGPSDENPGPAELGRIREAELRAAAAVLGIREVSFLDYLDGDVDRAAPTEAVARIAGHLRRVRPQVVVTFGPEGGYGHPDHIAVSQLTSAAVIAAADPADGAACGVPHQVAKLYYRLWTETEVATYQSLFGDVVMEIDGVERRAMGWPDWAITTRVDTAGSWPVVRAAITCHRTQLNSYRAATELPDSLHQRLWGSQSFYRAFSLVNGGRTLERDLFSGLRRIGVGGL